MLWEYACPHDAENRRKFCEMLGIDRLVIEAGHNRVSTVDLKIFPEILGRYWRNADTTRRANAAVALVSLILGDSGTVDSLTGRLGRQERKIR